MEMQYLNCFYVLSQTLNFHEASKRLFVTQPAVSHQIKKLEDQLKLKLFIRYPRKIVLSEAGKTLARYAHQVFQLMTEAEAHLEDISAHPTGLIRIALLTGLAKTWFIPFVLRMGEKYPRIKFNIKVSGISHMFEMLEKNEVDFAISINPPRHEDFKYLEVAKEEAVFVAPPGHPLFAKKKPSFEDFLDAEYCLYEYHDALVHQWFLEGGGRIPGSLKASLVCNHHEGIKMALARGKGCSVLPRHVVAAELESGILKEMRVGNHRIFNPISVVFIPRQHMLQKEELFLEEIKAPATM